jgi:hypothetical protein
MFAGDPLGRGIVIAGGRPTVPQLAQGQTPLWRLVSALAAATCLLCERECVVGCDSSTQSSPLFGSSGTAFSLHAPRITISRCLAAGASAEITE